jgi:ParB family chromosome partitioning protein
MFHVEQFVGTEKGEGVQGVKKNQRMALGRGLSALVSSAAPVAATPPSTPLATQVPENTIDLPGRVAAADPTSGVQYIDITRISANPEQPRVDFPEQEINELSESIKALGVLQPILVRPWQGSYQIVAGERRFRASIRAGLSQVPVLIKELSDRDTFEVALVENVQRLNLNPLEEARGYQRLMDEFNLNAQEVAARVGKDRATVANLVRILRLPPVVQEYLREGIITVGHAKAILTVKEPAAQTNLAQKVIDESLSLRALEAIVSREVILEEPKKPRTGKKIEASQFPEIEERLRNALGTKVTIRRSKKGGAVELHFFSDSELDRLIDIISTSKE